MQFRSIESVIILQIDEMNGPVSVMIPVILAAGMGKRLKSSVPKPLMKMKGRPMVMHIL